MLRFSIRQYPIRYAWLVAILIGTTLACNMLSGLGRDMRQVQQTGQAALTEVQGFVTQNAPMLETARAFVTSEGSSLLQTAQAVATQNPGLLETAKAFATEGLPELQDTLESAATEHPELAETLRAAATDQPGLLETLGAMATRYAEGGANTGEVPEDIPLVDRSTLKDLYVADVLITYSTSLDYATVLDFYKEQMPAKGWTASETGTFETGSTAMLSYEKPDRTANLILTGDVTNNQVSVVIQISPK
jgi:hypothetical protein